MMTSGGDGHDKDSDLGIGYGDDNSNVIPLRPRTKKPTNSPTPTPPAEPLFNMPPVTKYMLGTFVAVHLLVAFAFPQEMREWAYMHLGFIPARFSDTAMFEPLALITPFTYMLLHGGWLHIAMNGVMLLAFGSGIERWIGGQRMIALFVMGGLCGVAAHFALNLHSVQPVVGASGGISALFAAALMMLNRNGALSGQGGGRNSILKLIILWVGISVLFGFIGSPDGGEIAWAAHVGGFLGGFAGLKLLRLI